MKEASLAEPDFLPLPAAERKLEFVARARRFAQEHRREPAFLFLRRFCRCDEAGLELLMSKIFCSALSNYDPLERKSISCLKSLAQPFYYLLSKTPRGKPETRALFHLHTCDQNYFELWHREIYESLPVPKRVSASTARGARPADWLLTDRSVTLRSCVWFLAVPFLLPALWRLSRRYRLNLIAPFRKALSTYAIWDGFFRLHPCVNFIAYDAVENHPARHFAFHQSGGRRLAAIQNGDYAPHPLFAFGSVDAYFTFGEYTRRVCRDTGIQVERVFPVGALPLNAWWRRLQNAQPQPAYDVLFIDEGLWPRNGMDEKTGRSIDKIILNLDVLKKRHPALRVACQLRPYNDPALKKWTKQRLAALLSQPIDILENSGQGESYRNVAASRVVVVFHSTLGFESFFLGRGVKPLYVNYADDPREVYCDDPRFQLYDPRADPAVFERQVLFLLDLKLKEPPPVARDRLFAVDGRANERIIEALKDPYFTHASA